jgi:ketosteroid isomerase-like protein
MATTMSQDTSAMRQGIDATNRGFEAAVRGGDPVAAAQETYTADARILPPGAPMIEGRDAIAGFWTAAGQQLGITGVQLATLDLQPMGDGAYEIGRATLSLASGQSVEAKYVVIWRQEEGKWRWHVDMWNMDG